MEQREEAAREDVAGDESELVRGESVAEDERGFGFEEGLGERARVFDDGAGVRELARARASSREPNSGFSAVGSTSASVFRTSAERLTVRSALRATEDAESLASWSACAIPLMPVMTSSQPRRSSSSSSSEEASERPPS